MDNTLTIEFIQALQRVRRQPGSLADMGLVIVEPNSTGNIEGILSEINSTAATDEIMYDNNSSDESTIKAVVESLQKGFWPVLHIKKDIGSQLLNQLQHLANSNNIQIDNFAGKEMFEMNLPENSRLIAVAERDLLENTISYPHFYKLFGPILTI